MKDYLKFQNQTGLSGVAAVLALMIFVLFMAVAVSLVTTGSNIAVQEEQGVQAFYIAEGGLQYTIMRNNFPNYGVSPSVNLGIGSFTVSVPTLSGDITAATTGPITVSSTDGFIRNPGDATNQYWIMLCGVTGNPTPDVTSSNTCEKISFTNKTATTFTGGTRGRDSSVAAVHPATSVVLMYLWYTTNPAPTTIATRNLGRNDNCSTPARTICVNSTTNFASSGFIRINDGTEDNIEDVFYSGIGGAGQCGPGCGACLGTNGCVRRAYDGNKKGTVNHVVGTTVWQSEIVALPTSTGVISINVLAGNITRVVQGRVMPLY